MGENPYQSPTAYSDLRATPVDSGAVTDGDMLIVTSGTVLPAVCVKTNQPVEETELKQKVLTWCPPWVAIFVVFGGVPIVLIAYLIARRNCKLTFALDPSERKKYRLRILYKGLAAVAFFFAMPLTAAMDSDAVSITMMILFIIAFIAIFVGNAPLRVVKHRKGSFWVKGFSPEYLERFAVSPAG